MVSQAVSTRKGTCKLSAEDLSKGLETLLIDSNNATLPSIQVDALLDIPGTDAALSLTGTKQASGWSFTGKLADGSHLPLKPLIDSFVPGVDVPDGPQIDSLQLDTSSAGSYRLQGTVSEVPGWTIDLGSETLTIKDLTFDIAVKDKNKVDGSFQGVIALGSLALQLNYKEPGDFAFRADCDELSFNELVKRFSGKKALLPPAFNPSVSKVSLLFKKTQDTTLFEVGGSVGDDSFAFEAKNPVTDAPGKWGYIGGIQLLDPKLSKLPGLEPLAPLEKVVALKDLTLVAANFKSDTFQFPNAAEFSKGANTQHKMPAPTAGGLQPGLNVYGKWQLDTTRPDLKLLKQFLGLDPELDITLQVSPEPAKSSRLFLSYTTTVNKNWPLTCELGVAMNQGTPELFVVGELDAKIQKQPCQFDVAMSFVKSGMYLGGTMQGTLRFDELQISNLALMFGMNWGGIPSLGVAGMLNFPNFSGSVALLFDANDPSKSLVAGSVSDLSLLDVAEELAQTKDIPDPIAAVLDDIALEGTQPFLLPTDTSEALNELDLEAVSQAFSEHGKVQLSSGADEVLLVVKKPSKSWHLTDVANSMMHYQLTKTSKGIRVTLDTQLYIAPQDSQIGSLTFNQGFFLNGILNIAGFKWASQVTVNTKKGIAVDTYLNKALVIYKPHFFALSDLEGKQGPRLSLSTYTQPQLEVKEFRDPHFYLNGKLSMLGVDVAESFVQISESGFRFLFAQERALVVGAPALSASVSAGFQINGSFNSIENFEAGGDISVAMKGKLALGKLSGLSNVLPGVSLNKLGTLSVDLAASGSAQVGYQKNKAFGDFEGSFTFEGQSFSFHEKLSVEDKAFEKVGDLVFQQLENIVKEILKEAEKWLEWAKKGLLEGVEAVEEMGQVLHDVYKKSAEEAAELLRHAGKEFREIGRALKSAYKQSAQEVAGVLSKVGAETEEIADAIQDSFQTGAKELAQALSKVANPEEIAGALRSVGQFTAEQTAKAFRDLGKDVTTTAKALKSAYKLSANQAARTLNKLGTGVQDIGKALKGVYGQSASAAAKTLKDLGKSATEVAGVLKTSYKQSAQQAANVLNGIRYNTKQIGSALKGAFRQSATDMAKTLRGLKKGSREIAQVLKDSYKQSAQQAAKILNGIGCSINDVGDALKNTYRQSAKDTAKILKGIGKTTNQIAGVLKGTFKQSASQASKTLSDIGASVDQIGDALKNVYKQSGEQAAKIFKWLGKDSKQVAKTLKNTFKMSAKSVSSTMKSVYKLGKKELNSVLKGAGYASKEIGKAVGSVFKKIGSWF